MSRIFEQSQRLMTHSQQNVAVAWLKPEELPALDWVEADLTVVATYRRRIRGTDIAERDLWKS